MNRKKTKAQREAEQKAALLQRIEDIYSGALGMGWGEDEFATAEILSRVIPAIHDRFSLSEWMTSPHALHNYDNAETATKMLFESGVRA